MSSLINDLNSIYEIKQQIKEVAYIESDIFAEYPAYIAEAIQSGGATGTTTITGNGTYNVATYQYAYVDVPQQEVPVVPPGYAYVDGYTAIISNGEYDIASYAYAYIDVPAPEGWILPTGTAFITTNGEFDIHLYESAYVTVPQDGIDWDEVASYGYIVPAGTYNVNENGTFYTAEYAYTYVSVPQDGIDWDEVASYGYIVPSGILNIGADGNYNVTYLAYVNVNTGSGGGGLPTYAFSDGYALDKGTLSNIGYYVLNDINYEEIIKVITEDYWTYAFPVSGYVINDPAFNDPQYNLYVINDDVNNECTWQAIDYDYQNLPDWNTAHLAKESYDYYKGVVTFIPEYNRESYEVVPCGMNKKYNSFSYVGLCSYGTSWSTENTLFNKGAYMPLKKDSNVINNINQAYWLTSQKVTYSGNAGVFDGSYISSFFGSSWNAIIDKDGYIMDIISKVSDTNASQAKWGSDDIVTTTSNDISISGYITTHNYGNYINTPNNLYINFDTIPSYVSNQPYLFKYGFEPEFSSDINTSGITSYSTSKQVVLSANNTVSDANFSDIVNNYSEFTFEYTLTIPKRFFMDPENNPATLDYTFTNTDDTPSSSETITAVQTQISQQWYTQDRKSGSYDNGYYVTSVSKSKTGEYMSGYKVNEINITGDISGQLNLIPVIDNVLYFDDNISTATGIFTLTERTDQNGVTFINADAVTGTNYWTMEIKVPEGALDSESPDYNTCIITVTKS